MQSGLQDIASLLVRRIAHCTARSYRGRCFTTGWMYLIQLDTLVALAVLLLKDAAV